jgi:large subunit ribosomal protein L24e
MKCAYCTEEIKKGQGIMYVYKTGNTAFYCSSKCFKNDVVLGRRISSKLTKKTQAVPKAK